jgi:hypothetical protein
MAENFDTYDALLGRLRTLIVESGPRIIGIEGHTLARKGILSETLAEDLNAGWISTDDSAIASLYSDGARTCPEDTPYVDCLDLDRLGALIGKALSNHTIVIVAGICLRDVLERIGCQADILIYVKVVSRYSEIWHDKIQLEDYEAGREQVCRPHRDAFDYHSRVRPHEKADLVLTRME